MFFRNLHCLTRKKQTLLTSASSMPRTLVVFLHLRFSQIAARFFVTNCVNCLKMEQVMQQQSDGDKNNKINLWVTRHGASTLLSLFFLMKFYFHSCFLFSRRPSALHMTDDNDCLCKKRKGKPELKRSLFISYTPNPFLICWVSNLDSSVHFSFFCLDKHIQRLRCCNYRGLQCSVGCCSLFPGFQCSSQGISAICKELVYG